MVLFTKGRSLISEILSAYGVRVQFWISTIQINIQLPFLFTLTNGVKFTMK